MEVQPCAMVEILSVSGIAHHVEIVTQIVRKGDLATRIVSLLSQL